MSSKTAEVDLWRDSARPSKHHFKASSIPERLEKRSLERMVERPCISGVVRDPHSGQWTLLIAAKGNTVQYTVSTESKRQLKSTQQKQE